MTRARKLSKAIFFAAALGSFLAMAACSASMEMDAGGSLGATPGGAQDVGLFREKIERGQVPSSSDVTIEGLLAEHDLPVLGDACTTTLCIHGATAIAKGRDDGDTTAWVQVGFSSTLHTDTFQRPDLDLSLVFDRSGSMSGDKIVAALQALRKAVSQLGPRDRLSIVLFDDRVDLLVAPTFVTDAEKERIGAMIDGIEPRGATDIESGLARGYELLRADAANKSRSHRVMLFTDALPNTGRTDAGSFVNVMQAGATQGIGLTAFGIGLDFGQELVHQISQVRGGAYYFLQDAEKVRTVFDQDFEYLVTPIAYDMKVRVAAQSSYTFTRAYGVPSASIVEGQFALDVPTVFVSRRKGAVILRFLPQNGASIDALGKVAHLSIDYQTPTGETVHRELDATYGGRAAITDGFQWYQQLGVRKAVALTNWALGVKKALEMRESGRAGEARAMLDETRKEFEVHVSGTNDVALARELTLIDRLRTML